MQPPLALSNLMHGKWRTLVSTSGVSLAIILVFMQFGFLGAVRATATQIYDHLEFDVLLRSPDYFHFCDPREISRTYLHRVAALPQVESVKPLHVTLATWRIPATEQTVAAKTAGELRGVVAMGIDPSANVFDLPEIEQQMHKLRNPHALLIDRKTKGSDFGASDGKTFGDMDNDREVEVWDKNFQIVGNFALGAGLAANGSVLMSSTGYGRFFPTDTVDHVNFGLVRLKPGVHPEQFCQEVRNQFAGTGTGRQEVTRSAPPSAAPPSAGTLPVTILTRAEVRWREQARWLLGTPIGAIFMAGVVIALVVGSVVVYMVLANDVANHIHEYATLKAMGYPNRFLGGVVMQQAMAMALLGYIVSLACAELLYRLVGQWANLTMEMTWTIRILVLVLSILMCCTSGLATLRKLRKAEPADLF